MSAHHFNRTRLVASLGALVATVALLAACAPAEAESAHDAASSEHTATETVTQTVTDTATVTASAAAHTDVTIPSAAQQSAQTGLYTAMRGLWDEHMAWTWNAVVAFADDPAALDATLARLLDNQQMIGDAIKPFYGDAAGESLTALLKEHIQDAVPVLTAAKAGDTNAVTAAVDTWYANAEEIGAFLSGANPAWPADDMREMMRGHITQTVAYASDVLGGDFASAITHFDEAQQHMAQMADMLSAGIIAQFPDKF